MGFIGAKYNKQRHFIIQYRLIRPEIKPYLLYFKIYHIINSYK